MKDSQYLVIVSVPDETALISLASRALAEDVTFSLWSEPDLNGERTALCLEPGDAARRLCSNLPLHGRDLRAVA